MGNEGLPPDLAEVVKQAMNIRIGQSANGPCHEIAEAVKVCESPIEVAMLCALTVVAGGWYSCTVRVQGRDWGASPPVSFRVVIEPQAQLGEYRVDFLLTASVRKYGDVGGGNWDEIGVSECRMVVECDGFEYHDRTTEQARRDRERDRALQSLGVLVYRYTGSEIWEDVFKAAQGSVQNVMRAAIEAARAQS